MSLLVTILHIFACLALILIVLLQSGKGAQIGATLGGAGGQTLFGATGAATFLSKATTAIAVLFMLSSLYLAWDSGHVSTKSVMGQTPVEETQKAETPAAPAAPAAESQEKAAE